MFFDLYQLVFSCDFKTVRSVEQVEWYQYLNKASKLHATVVYVIVGYPRIAQRVAFPIEASTERIRLVQIVIEKRNTYCPIGEQ